MLMFRDILTGQELILANIRDCQERLARWDTDVQLLSQSMVVRDNAKNGLKEHIVWWESKLNKGE